MQKRTVKIISLLSLLVILFILPLDLLAQCPMCKMAAESNLNNGGTAGKGLNAGILFMLATPYILVGTFAYIWIRNRRREEEELLELVD